MFKIFKLGEVCSIESGSRGKGGASTEGIPSIGGEQISSTGYVLTEKMKYITEEHFKKMKQGVIKPDDTLLVKDGATTGKCAFYRNEYKEATVNEHVFILRANNLILPKFLYYVITSDKFQNKIKSNIKGIIGGINLSIKNLEIVIPDKLAEQQEIVQVLDTMNEIIRLREECISHAQELISSLFIEIFGDPIKNDKNYKTYAIKSLGKVTTGTTPSSSKENMFGGNIPFVTPGDLETDGDKYNRYLTEEGALNSRIVRAGSTLVCCIGATIGKVDIAKIKSCFNQQINAIEWNNEDINDVYALYLFRLLAPLIKEKASNTTLPILNKRNFENIFIPKPDIKIQEQFAQKAIEIEAYIKEQQEELENAKQMFQSLLHHAFTGELTRHKFGGEANG